jgi:hypothetical protein
LEGVNIDENLDVRAIVVNPVPDINWAIPEFHRVFALTQILNSPSIDQRQVFQVQDNTARLTFCAYHCPHFFGNRRKKRHEGVLEIKQTTSQKANGRSLETAFQRVAESSVKRIHLYYDYKAEVAKLAGTVPLPSLVDRTNYSDTIMIALDGSIPAIFISRQIDPKFLKRAYRNLRKVKGLPTQRLHATAHHHCSRSKKTGRLSGFQSVPKPVLELLKNVA